MYTEINAVVQSANTLFEIVKANKSLLNYNEVVSAVSEVNTKLMGATAVALASQEKQSQLSDRIRELENEIMQLKNWQQESERYRLTEIGTSTYAFTLKPGMENEEPAHKLCGACFGKKQKGYLSLSNIDGRGKFYKCSTCGTEICCFDHSYLSNFEPDNYNRDYNPLDNEY